SDLARTTRPKADTLVRLRRQTAKPIAVVAKTKRAQRLLVVRQQALRPRFWLPCPLLAARQPIPPRERLAKLVRTPARREPFEGSIPLPLSRDAGQASHLGQPRTLRQNSFLDRE